MAPPGRRVFEAWYPGQQYGQLRLFPEDSRGGQEAGQVTITNTGDRAGTEVAQLYLTDPASAGEPPYQLKGFQKVMLAPGQSKVLTFPISLQDMSYYQAAGPAVGRVSRPLPGQHREQRARPGPGRLL